MGDAFGAGRDGDGYLGTIRIRVGPITSVYSGVARFISQDLDRHEVIIEAEGRDKKTAGKAKAIVHVRLAEESGSTTVLVATDLTITGKIAQLGQGVIADVSAKLMEKFAQNLAERLMASYADEPPRSIEPNTGSGEVVDLDEMVRPWEKARVLGLVVAVGLVLWFIRSRRRC